MKRSGSRAAALWFLAAAVTAGCGKKGDPLPPLRPVPVRIENLSVARTANGVELRFTVPEANLDGTTPPAVDRVDVFGLPTGGDAVAPLAGQIAADQKNIRARVAVRRVDPDAPAPAATAANMPAPGEVAVVLDDLQVTDPSMTAMYYVVVPVSGSGRGRPGPPSAAAVLPLGPLPEPPRDVTVTHDETLIRVGWTTEEPDRLFRVFRAPRAGEVPGEPVPLTPVPIAATEFTLPVEFSAEVCLSVRALTVAGAVSSEGAPSIVRCITPVDKYAPPAPGGLRVVQEGTGVTLIWDAVSAGDLAGYVVLRGEGAGASLQPLMREPIRETTFRDTTVQTGVTYVYAVYAVDTSPAANISQLSSRESLTVR